MTSVTDYPITFDCRGHELLGIVHAPVAGSEVGVVIVVGGPQYRVGSHRMFVELARALANADIPVLRFDCRGMGDSDGEFTSFEDLSDDIRASVDAFAKSVGVRHVVLVGLCDGASACAIYAASDSRVVAMVMMNPWVRSSAGEAKARISHYYGARIRQREFWRRLFSGEVNVFRALIGLTGNLRRAAPGGSESGTDYIERMLAGISGFQNAMLILLSGEDLIAKEFAGLIDDSIAWHHAVHRPNVTLSTLAGVDHTFSGEGALDGVARRIVEFSSNVVDRLVINRGSFG